MKPIREREIAIYETPNGKKPFEEWLMNLDGSVRAIVRARIKRVRGGNLGNCKLVGVVFELKMEVGGGIRVYFSYHDGAIILLLCGGNKATQRADIEKATKYFEEFRRRNP